MSDFVSDEGEFPPLTSPGSGKTEGAEMKNATVEELTQKILELSKTVENL